MNAKHLCIIALLLVCFGLLVRLMPHLPNATPITAIAFVASMYLGKRWALALPVVTLALSDLFVGLYDWRIMISVYGSFVLIGFVSWYARTRRTPLVVGCSVIGSALLFFAVTNTAVWMFSPWYEKSIVGLLYCYELALPFLRNMILGDVLYTFALVAAFEIAFASAPHLRRVRAVRIQHTGTASVSPQ